MVQVLKWDLMKTVGVNDFMTAQIFTTHLIHLSLNKSMIQLEEDQSIRTTYSLHLIQSRMQVLLSKDLEVR